MISRRLFAIELALLLGLGSVFFLPKAPETSPVGISLKLPIWVGSWLGEETPVTQRELEVLAKDTEFARKIYTSPAGDKIYVSIVLSGDDMTSSIHRPERCLPAQGWNLQNTSGKVIPISGSRPLKTTQLSSVRMIDAKGRRFPLKNLTPSHFTRTMLDLRDRILHGYNQRWAYVTVAATVTEGVSNPQRSEAETKRLLEGFISQLGPKLSRPDGGQMLAASER
jgi:uncharacterized protein DUF3485